VVGALSAVHQFVRVGAHSYIGGGAMITQDVLPLFDDVRRARDACLRPEQGGLGTARVSKERIRKIQQAYKILLTSKRNTTQALEKAEV